MSGARRSDRAGGPADLSREGVSAKGAHPSRGFDPVRLFWEHAPPGMTKKDIDAEDALLWREHLRRRQ